MEKEEWETRLRVAGDQTLCVGGWELETRSLGVRGRKGLRQVGALKLEGWGDLGAGELLRREEVEED